jgi:ribosomal protein L7/L12
MINIQREKIKAIKALREFCHETFGVGCGLKVAKDFIEEMIAPQVETIAAMQKKINTLYEVRHIALIGLNSEDYRKLFPTLHKEIVDLENQIEAFNKITIGDKEND